MITISAVQQKRIKDHRLHKFAKNTLCDLSSSYPEVYQDQSDAYWQVWIIKKIEEAEVYGFFSEEDVREYLELALLYKDIHSEAKPTWFVALMKRKRMDNRQRLNRLAQQLETSND